MNGLNTWLNYFFCTEYFMAKTYWLYSLKHISKIRMYHESRRIPNINEHKVTPKATVTYYLVNIKEQKWASKNWDLNIFSPFQYC
jgi:hypothetical protein